MSARLPQRQCPGIVQLGVLVWAMLAAVLAGGGSRTVSASPEQVSLQVSQDTNGICVFWITVNQTSSSGVRFGTAPGRLSMTQWSKDQVQYTFRRRGYTSEWLHKVYLKGLSYDTLYYYRAGDWADGWSAVHWFRTRPKSSDPVTVSMAVLADQSVNAESSTVLDSLLQQQSRFNYHALLHAGDISYADGNQTIWDEYGRWWSAFSAYHPVAYAVGDKDIEGGGTNAYAARMRNGLGLPGQRWDWQRHWYTFELGSVRVIFLSSEHADDDIQVAKQTSWLNRTLQEADHPQTRKMVPWILVVIHRPLHNSPPADGVDGPISESLKDNIEVLFREYRVNVVVTGHCHNYERTYPMYNETITQLSRGWAGTPYHMRVYAPKAPWVINNWGVMYTTVGTGGSPVEDLGRHPPELDRPCIARHTNGNEDENYIMREHDCSNGCWSQKWSTYMNSEKGFGVFEANHTMLYFQYFSAEQNRVIDEAIICALPGCKTPQHMKQVKPDTLTAAMPLPATVKAPPVPPAPPSAAQHAAPGTLDSFYPDDVREEDMYDETSGSPAASSDPQSQLPGDMPLDKAPEAPPSFVEEDMYIENGSPVAASAPERQLPGAVPVDEAAEAAPYEVPEDMEIDNGSPVAASAPESQIPAAMPLDEAAKAPLSDDVEQVIPSGALPLSQEDEGQGANTAKQVEGGTEADAVDRGLEDTTQAALPEELPEFVQQPGAFQYIPISQVEDNLPNGGLFAPNMKGYLEQESVGGKVIIDEFPSDDGKSIEEDVDSASKGSVDPKPSEADREVDKALIVAAESGGSLPIGLILAVVALCFAALLGIIALVGLLIIQRRSSKHGDNPEMGHRMHAIPPQLCTNTAADLSSLEITPRFDLTPRSAASRMSWTAGKMLSSVLETPRMRSLRDKHNPEASQGAGEGSTSGDTPVDAEAAAAGDQ